MKCNIYSEHSLVICEVIINLISKVLLTKYIDVKIDGKKRKSCSWNEISSVYDLTLPFSTWVTPAKLQSLTIIGFLIYKMRKLIESRMVLKIRSDNVHKAFVTELQKEKKLTSLS